MNELQTVNNGALVAQQDISEELFTRFIQFIDAKPKTIETYTRAIRQLFKYLAENNIRRPTREDIIAYRDSLKETHKATTVQNYITAARLFFQWLESERIYPNVAAHIKGATISKDHKKDYLTSKQVKNILNGIERDTPQGLRDYAILALMVTGGLRDIEVSRATVEDIRNVGNNTVLFIQGKGRDEKSDYIKIQPEIEEAIREYLKTRGTVEPTEPLFTSEANRNKGGMLTTRSISRIVKGRLQAAGYDSDRLTAHSLRHTAVTLSLIGGKSLQETHQFARHSNIATTQVYAHNLDRAKNNCEEVIAKAIFR